MKHLNKTNLKIMKRGQWFLSSILKCCSYDCVPKMHTPAKSRGKNVSLPLVAALLGSQVDCQ